MDFLQAIIMGSITGLFSGGAVWGVIRTEMKYMRRDIDDLRVTVYKEERMKK